MGIGQRPILEAMDAMPADARHRALKVLLAAEERAAAESGLAEGASELLGLMRSGGIASALITRNSRSSVDTVLARHALRFDALVTREDGLYKPHPRAVLLACEMLGVAANEAWMVGDGQYDVEAGLAAGCPTVWLSHGRPKPFAAQPWKTVDNLAVLTAVLRECLNA
jgi:HAD superfamily hydrolase (TIGR01549 family)